MPHAGIAVSATPFQCDAVIHLASPSSDARGSKAAPLAHYRAMIEPTIALLGRHAPPARFIYASSSIAAFPDSSPYAASKAVCERIVIDTAASHGFPAVILRPFVVAGAVGPHGESHRPETHLVPLAVMAALAGTAITVNAPAGSRGAIRDYIHLADVVRAFEMAMTAAPGLYEVGTGLGSSIMDVAEAAGCRFEYAHCASEPPALVSDPARWISGWRPSMGLYDVIASDRAFRLAQPKP